MFSRDDLEQFADRIEKAYRRRHSPWRPVALTPGVWESAAARLCEALEDCPKTPIDPELFVAVQPATNPRRDPWAELTQARSLRRYVRAIREIVGRLRSELREEVRRAELRMIRGESLDRLVTARTSRLSPLTRYILAHRAGRDDLSAKLRAAAECQHRACPLYCPASVSLLPADAYPMPGGDASEARTMVGRSASFSLN